MEYSLRVELDSCISQLYRIASELEDAAIEVKASISGMNTKKYTQTLYSCAEKYRRAARKLEKIK